MGILPRQSYWSEERQSHVLPLSQELEALIDAEDIALVTDRCWSATSMRGAMYAVCPNNLRAKCGSQYLHRFLLGLGKAGWVRFRNSNTLDCRRHNLVHDEPVYVLNHGIVVMAEVAPNKSFPYWRLYIKPHPLFDAALAGNGFCLVRRSRAVKAAEIGRMLLETEHVHHKNENREDDSPDNLELLSAAAHNSHHKTGARHSNITKARIGKTLRTKYRTGQRAITGAALKQMEGRRAFDS
jgi:hypothetical protein